MKVAFFSPLQPVRSGISDYNEDLIPYLYDLGVRFDFFYEKEKPTNSFIRKNCESYSHEKFPDLFSREEYDTVVYHIGNNRVHDYMYKYIFDFPGVVVLHDFFLHHARLATYVESGNLPEYIKEMDADDLKKTGEIISGGMGGELMYYTFPLNRQVIKAARVLVMHNSYYPEKIREQFPNKILKFIPHNAHHSVISKKRSKKIRSELSIPQDAIVIASFGFMNETKKIGLISQVLRRLMPGNRDIYYLICGEDKEGIVEQTYFDYPEIKERLKVSGYIEGMDSFIEYIEISDIVLNLRFPSAGETSGTMIRSMAQGKPVIVYDLPVLSDIPDNALMRIPYVNDFRSLYEALKALTSSKELRTFIGKNALNYVKSDLDMERNARLYLDALNSAVDNKSSVN